MTLLKNQTLPFCAMLLLAVSLSLHGQDGAETRDDDGDGLSNLVEAVLGTDPAFAEKLTLVGQDPTLAEGDHKSSARKKVPDMTNLYFANVAQNRWLWRIDFADRFEGVGANLLLYMDVDNDLATGRAKGAPGTDLRLMYHSGAFQVVVRNTAVCARDRGLRGLAIGNSLYFCMDFNPRLDKDGVCDFRAYALCQMDADPRDSDPGHWFDVKGAQVRDVAKRPAGVFSQGLSTKVDARRLWLGWREDLQAADPVFLHPDTAKITGMKRYNLALEPIAESATAAWEAPERGAWYLNVLLQDSAVGRETVTVQVDGETVATLVAGENDGDLVLFATREPVMLKRKSVILLTAAAPAQDFRISEATLTRRPITRSPLGIRYLETYCHTPTGSGTQVDVCFLTNNPCKGTIRWGRDGALDQTVEEEKGTYNHLLTIPGVALGETLRVQIVAKDGEDQVESEVLTVVATPRRLEKCGVRRKRIQLSIKDMLPGDRVRPLWPVASGIPIPKGQLASSEKCRLLDADGAVVSAQFSELAHWPDGSVKWVLLSTVTPSGRTEYTFEYGRRVSTPTVAQPILIAESADALEIDTGRLRARLSKSHFSPPGELWVDGKKVFAGSGEGLTLVDEQGNRFTSSAAAPVRFVIEERGAIRTVVCVEGPLTGPKGKRLSYRCRLYFYRDFPGLPMVVHLLGDEGKTIFPPSMHRIDSFTMPMPLAADSAAGPAQRILHDEDNHYTSTVDGRKTDHAGTHNGVMATQTNGQSVQLVVKDFWRLFPKGLSCDEKMLTAEIFPLLPGDQYADVTDPKQLTINYYWYQKGAYMIPCGTEPSTDFMLYFGAADSATLSESVNATLALAPTPEQMTASGAFWDLEPEREGVFEEYASFVRSGLENIEQRKRSGRWYSWMNYGDTYGERGVNWTNQEYDLQWGMLVQYARNGDLRFLHTAEAHARHTASIDQITWSPTSSHFGIQKEHALWHVGGFGTPRIPGAKYWFQNGIYNTGHMWSQGTYAAYCLTGDRRLKDAIDHLTHWMSTHYTTYLERWVHRNYGWSTLVMLGAYGVEPHPHSLNAARLFMWNVCSKQDPGTGVFIHPIGECTHQPRHMGGKAFMSGVEMTALKYMHQLEGNEAYKTALLKTADWMHTRMWHPGNAGFQYAECTKFDGASSSSGVNMLCEGMAYVYELTRDKRYLEMVAKPLAVNFRKSSASGKGYAMQVRMTPFALSTLERLRVKRLPDVEGPAPKILSGSALHLAPGEPAKLSLTIVHENYEPMRAEIRITSLPKGLQAKPDRVKWKAARGATTSPVITFTGAADAGAAIELECRVGKQVSTRTLRIVHAEQLFLGEGVGIVTAPADPVGLALKALGCQLTPLPDLKPETLARYRSILVGSEAHEKHYAGLPESAARLVDFARSGGRVVFMQFQNTSYQPSFLPLPVGMSDNKGSCAVINKPDHPVFNHPRKIATLKGLVSYDTLTGVDAGWTILATDNRGNPSILETAVGKGRILLVQPSPDRYVLGLEKPFGELRTTTCEALLRNLIAYLQED